MMKRSHSPYVMNKPSSTNNSPDEKVEALDLSKPKYDRPLSSPPISTVIKSEPTSPDKTPLWPETVEQTINYNPMHFPYFSHISSLSTEKPSQSIVVPFVQSQLKAEPYLQPQSTVESCVQPQSTTESRIQLQHSVAMDVSSSTRNSPDSSGSSLLVPAVDLTHPLPLLSPSTSKPTRPFKAYPKQIMTDGAFFDPEMQVKYVQFKKDFFSNATNYTQSTNPKMRRTNTRTHSEDDSGKDEAYRERRRKNNDAAKRSRDARRKKEDEIAIKAAFLEKENLELKATIKLLIQQVNRYCQCKIETAKMLN